MSLPKFAEIISLSNKETRQTFKPNELKNGKRKLAQLKTLLGMRLEEKEGNEENIVSQLIPN
jgi:hypothetical protein